MTETVSGATTRKGKATQAPNDPDDPGGTHPAYDAAHPHHPGVHPYDQVTWERRDA